MAGQNHAIVIGASMGGLLAARALADFYQQVTLIERDAFPPIGENRKGVPQGRHTHALLLRGGEILEGFFPGLTADLMAQGAPFLDRPENELIWFDGGGYHARFTNEDGRNGALMVSRPLLEGYVRQRLLALPNVTAIEQCDALGLVPSERAGRVAGRAHPAPGRRQRRRGAGSRPGGGRQRPRLPRAEMAGRHGLYASGRGTGDGQPGRDDPALSPASGTPERRKGGHRHPFPGTQTRRRHAGSRRGTLDAHADRLCRRRAAEGGKRLSGFCKEPYRAGGL
ncbi:MAG: hypothetical protein KatS3mg131_3509 [Candidatus Tectimicrobiota bacterium]|nr:MAG: hypothetical protein KatS3mg131_3509 [Candidatus Tectomicrobia bacterium]